MNFHATLRGVASIAVALYAAAAGAQTPPPPFGAIGREVSRNYAAESLTNYALITLRNINPIVLERLDQLRLREQLHLSRTATAFYEGVPPILLFQSGSADLGLMSTATDTQAAAPWGLFATLSGDRTRQTTVFSATTPTTIAELGYDSRFTTLSAGGDYRLSKSLLVGAALSAGPARSTLSDISNGIISRSAGRVNSNVFEASLYGTWNGDRVYVDTLLTYSSIRFDIARNILTGSDVRQAEGSTRAHQLSAALSVGYDWRLGPTTISPYSRFETVRLKVNGYDERGSTGYETRVSNQSKNSLQASIGVRATHALSLDFGVIVPQAQLEFVNEFDGKPKSFAVTPLSNTLIPPPTSVSAQLDRRFFTFTLGATGQFANDWSGFLLVEHYIGLNSVRKTQAKLGVQKEL